MPLESLVSDATIWSMALELSIKTLDVSFTLMYDVYSIDITYGNRQLIIMMCLKYRSQMLSVAILHAFLPSVTRLHTAPD
jgi:hypothetical protein